MTGSLECIHFSYCCLFFLYLYACRHPSPVAVDDNVMEKMKTNGAVTTDRNITMEMIHDQAWLPFAVPGLLYKDLAISSHIKRGLKSRECVFWDTLRPKLQRYLGNSDGGESSLHISI